MSVGENDLKLYINETGQKKNKQYNTVTENVGIRVEGMENISPADVRMLLFFLPLKSYY